MVDFVLPPCPPTLHAQNSPTFRLPPLDGTLTVPELLDWNAEHSPEHPYFVYANNDNETVSVTHSQMWHAIRSAAVTVRGHVQLLQSRYDSQERPADRGPTIGILASAGA